MNLKMANFITSLRIVFSILLLFFKPFSNNFYILYFLAGLSDMIDGPIARKTNKAMEFGEKLDTAADFIFLLICFIKILPCVFMPKWLYIWIAIIALIKIFLYPKSITKHDFLNKITGFCLFLLPFSVKFFEFYKGAIICCLLASIAIKK